MKYVANDGLKQEMRYGMDVIGIGNVYFLHILHCIANTNMHVIFLG